MTSGCNRRRSQLRVRFTLEITTPGGVKAGSSVLQIEHVGRAAMSLPEENGSLNTIGQSPYVDLGQGHFVFVTLHDPNHRRSIEQTVLSELETADNLAKIGLSKSESPILPDIFDAAQDVPMTVELQPRNYPMLVTFGSVRKPDTVQQVDSGNMERMLGTGLYIRRMAFTVVDDGEDITSGFANKFPEIASSDNIFRKREAGMLRNADLVGRLSNVNFVAS
jgi:hypothetical protein